MPKKPKKDVPVKWYVGIVDTLGLDSLDEVGHNSSVQCMRIRAMANPQRHAKMFLASFPEKMEVLKVVRTHKDPWEMWDFIQAFAKEIRCAKEDAKTIQNMKQMADCMIACTGSAAGF